MKCAECNMTVFAGEYHPFAACLMYKGCGDEKQVRDNLNAVKDYSRTVLKEIAEVNREMRDKFLGPQKLRDVDKENFETLKKAFSNYDVALVSAIRKSTGESVALCCAVSMQNPEVILTPLAVMVEGDPYEEFQPPEGARQPT